MSVWEWIPLVQRIGKEEAASRRRILRVEKMERWDSCFRQDFVGLVEKVLRRC